MVRSNLPSPSPRPASAAGLIERLPAFHRSPGGAAARLLDAAAEDHAALERSLEEIEDGGMARLDADVPPAASVLPPASATAGALREWIAGRCGAAPALWPGVQLEELEDAAPPGEGAPRRRLAVSLRGRSRSLCLVWQSDRWPADAASMGAPPPSSRDFSAAARALDAAVPAALRTAGLILQWALLEAPLPRNPYVQGLPLLGELLSPSPEPPEPPQAGGSTGTGGP